MGYTLSSSGDQDSVIYETASTPANVSTTFPEPDVFLNASVHVGEIDITVSNITAKINLDAQVLELLQFNAGVQASIDRVRLLIQGVDAKVTLEARLANLVLMIGNVLDSLDLNPILATLGQSVGTIVNDTVGSITGGGSGSGSAASSSTERSFVLDDNILYSINDYSGNAHTNRILAQDGNIVDESLNNQGQVYDRDVVGNYLRDMTFNGYNETITTVPNASRQLEYVYTPYQGLTAVCAIYVDPEGNVVATKVVSESSGGGSSTIS
ncbi:hypothetical protein K402DRAFT_352378, partial [Aulographum hederae CBS 113979]